MEDDYKEIECIGKSQFEIYLIQKDGIQYAQKKMVKQTNGHYEQLINEAKYLQILDHPHIIKLINQNLTQDQDFYQGSLTLEFAQKRQLSKYVQEKGFKAEICRFYFRQLLLTLDYLHNQKQICHRDIKLDNIVLDENYNLKLIDFGLATEITGQKLTQCCGTLGHMAPEIYKQNYDGDKVDVFATGVALFQMYTCKLPFPEALNNKLYLTFKNHPKIYWQQFCDKYDDIAPSVFKEDFKSLILGMLKDDPNSRYRLIDCAQHQWTKGQTATQEEVILELKRRENIMAQQMEITKTQLRGSSRSALDDKQKLYRDIVKAYGLKFDKLILQKGKVNVFQDQILTNLDVNDAICEIIFKQQKFNGKFKQMTENKYEIVFCINQIEEDEEEEEDQEDQQQQQLEQQEFEKPEIIIEFSQLEEDLLIANVWNRNLNNQVFLSIFKKIEEIIKSIE